MYNTRLATYELKVRMWIRNTISEPILNLWLVSEFGSEFRFKYLIGQGSCIYLVGWVDSAPLIQIGWDPVVVEPEKFPWGYVKFFSWNNI